MGAKLFEPKDEIREAAEAIMAMFAARSRGTTITYDTILKVTGFDRDSTHWSAFIQRLKRGLRNKHGMTIESVRDLGYRSHTTDEQIHRRSIARGRKALRQMSMDVTELRALPDRELSDHQRVAKSRKLEHSRAGRRAVLGTVRIGHLLARPSGPGRERPRG